MTMFLIRIPECQEAAEVVAEYDMGRGSWEISSCNTDVKVYAETFEAGVREFAAEWSKDFKGGR